MNILETENLTKAYGKGDNKVIAVDDVTLKIKQGEFVAIIGASGSGKSTLLHLLGGVDRPTSGRVIIDGEDIFKHSDDEIAIFRRREIGIIYQFYNLIPVLTVSENITLPVDLANEKPDQEYLNVICHGRVKYLPTGWNKQSFPEAPEGDLNLSHFALANKPWHYKDTINSEYFWKYAKYSEFYDQILDEFNNFSEEDRRREYEGFLEIVNSIQRIYESENTFSKVWFKN